MEPMGKMRSIEEIKVWSTDSVLLGRPTRTLYEAAKRARKTGEEVWAYPHEREAGL